jgi:hypothetical protein
MHAKALGVSALYTRFFEDCAKLVAQIFNLLYRRFLIGAVLKRPGLGTFGRAADYKSALLGCRSAALGRSRICDYEHALNC